MARKNRYTVQFFINGYATPCGTDVDHFRNLRDIKRALQNEYEEAQRYGAGYDGADGDAPASVLIWYGVENDVSDMYPDAQASIGPRGGVRVSGC